jgi:3-oxoacyl-[acyl-carrier protein] reductase
MELDGQCAIVTGASRGIGRAIALELARAGARLVLAARNVESLEAVAEEVRGLGGQAVVAPVDLAVAEQAEQLIKQAQQHFQSVDILVNNAGVTRDSLLLRMKDQDWDDVLNLNLRTAFITTRAASKIMLRQKRGAIVNITSVIGVMGNAGQSNYAASKAGLIGFTKSIARELATRAIRVNAVAPGYIETDMTRDLPEQVKAQILNQIPLQRLGQSQDVADMVRFLVGPKAGYITGQVFHVDGGMLM